MTSFYYSAMNLPDYGPLQLRTSWSAVNRRNGHNLAHAPNGKVWILCPKVGAKLLAENDGASGQLSKNDISHRRDSLLFSALTQNSGADWARQRPAVVSAIGGGITVQSNRHRESSLSAAELVKELVSPGKVLDVMEISQFVAARGIVSAVVGCTSDIIEMTRKLESLLISYQKASRRIVHYDRNVCLSLEKGLRKVVKDLVEFYMKGIDRFNANDNVEGKDDITDNVDGFPTNRSKQPNYVEPTALLPRLLERKELSIDEAIGNTFSSLLAGIETTSLLIGCSLLQLATKPYLRKAVRNEISSFPLDSKKRSKIVISIMNETLRVHPPVMGLPRKVANPNGVRIELSPGCPAVMPYGTVFSVCLLSAAHCGNIQPELFTENRDVTLNQDSLAVSNVDSKVTTTTEKLSSNPETTTTKCQHNQTSTTSLTPDDNIQHNDSNLTPSSNKLELSDTDRNSEPSNLVTIKSLGPIYRSNYHHEYPVESSDSFWNYALESSDIFFNSIRRSVYSVAEWSQAVVRSGNLLNPTTNCKCFN